jgi:hypothetical protein
MIARTWRLQLSEIGDTIEGNVQPACLEMHLEAMIERDRKSTLKW